MLSPRQAGNTEDEALDEEMGREAEKYLDAVVKVKQRLQLPAYGLPFAC